MKKDESKRKKSNNLDQDKINPELRGRAIMDAGKFTLKLIGVALGVILLYIFFTWLAWIILS